MSEIYSSDAVNKLLGCICNDTSLILNDKYPLKKGEKGDFSPVIFHRIIFGACYGMTMQGAKYIDPMDMDIFIKDNFGQTNYQIFIDNDGMGYIETIKELSDPTNYELYYNSVRKHSLLRNLEKEHNIKFFWDYENSDDINEENINKYSIEEILLYFDKDISNIKREFSANSNITELKLGSWFKDIKNEFMKEPMYGQTLFSDYINTATRGFIKGQLSIFSMPSGSGKSTIGISTLCRIACDEIWDYETEQYIKNPCYENVGCLYLQYEMDSEYECTPKFVSAISGVPTNHILNGIYQEGEEKRVDKAIEIMDRSNIYIVTMPTFTTSLLENYIKDYRLSKNCQYVVFDYISEQASVNSEVAKKNGVTTRSDMVLSTIASKLKDIAIENNIAVMTFTQCNANINSQEYMDAGCIAGSRAVQNKADIAGILMPLRPKEESIRDTFVSAKTDRGFHIIKPNRILHLYKVRFGAEEQGIKIWLNVNLSNGHIIDCWVTNRDNKPYKMIKTKLEKE